MRADWRWLTDRDDSPWYPTARLFRQRRRGDWIDVVARVRAALKDRTAPQSPTAERAPLAPASVLPVVARPEDAPGYRAGMTAVAETRVGIVECDPDDDGEGTSAIWYGEWRQQQLDLLAGLIRPSATIVEVGAGVGVHAAFLAGAAGKEGHLFACEPRPGHHRMLRQNMAANRITNVTYLRSPLNARGFDSTAHRRSSETDATATPADNQEPEAITLDSLALDTLDWLKIADHIDAAGVLDGAVETLWRLRPSVFISLPDAHRQREISDGLQGYGYRCWRDDVPLFNPANFNHRTDDIFGGRRAVTLVAVPEERNVGRALDRCIEVA